MGVINSEGKVLFHPFVVNLDVIYSVVLHELSVLSVVCEVRSLFC